MTGIEGSGNSAHEVDGDEWLREIDRHPELFDTALRIAVAMLTIGTIGPDGLDDISEEDVNEEVEALVAVGFLEDQVSIAWTPGDAEEHSLRLRFPFGYTDLSGYTWPAELRTPGADR